MPGFLLYPGVWSNREAVRRPGLEGQLPAEAHTEFLGKVSRLFTYYCFKSGKIKFGESFSSKIKSGHSGYFVSSQRSSNQIK